MRFLLVKYRKDNPNSDEYHIDIDDKNNVLQKFEQLYQGTKVFFNKEDLPIAQQITHFLGINNCPLYMRQRVLFIKMDNQDPSDGVIIDTG